LSYTKTKNYDHDLEIFDTKTKKYDGDLEIFEFPQTLDKPKRNSFGGILLELQMDVHDAR
jgi:hypothetical protein